MTRVKIAPLESENNAGSFSKRNPQPGCWCGNWG